MLLLWEFMFSYETKTKRASVTAVKYLLGEKTLRPWGKIIQ